MRCNRRVANPLLSYTRICAFFLVLLGAVSLHAQDGPAASPAAPTVPAEPTQDKRIFGVLPNYRTVDGSIPFTPISSRRKFYIASKDSFDYPVFYIGAVFAGLYQLEDQTPSYGQGVKGYAKRYGAALADQSIGNILTEGVFPVLLHEDSRYFRKGEGRKWGRLGYAASRVVVGRTDKGKWDFNYSEWLGNASSAAISNLYYAEDTRDVRENVTKVMVAIGTDAFSNVLKEFWPDVKRKMFNKKAVR